MGNSTFQKEKEEKDTPVHCEGLGGVRSVDANLAHAENRVGARLLPRGIGVEDFGTRAVFAACVVARGGAAYRCEVLVCLFG
jgi:hypothetical protein